MRAALMMLAVATCPAAADIEWTFDNDSMGWGTLNDARNFEWDGTIGNGPGAIKARDVGDGRIWYFSAPTAELANLGGMYGGEISWDALGIQGNQTSISPRADVMLFGAGLEIGINVGEIPLLSGWTSWSASIDASSDWRLISDVGDGDLGATQATEAQIRAVLADLQGLHIRGEFTNGADRSALDNVRLVPAPGGLALLAIGGLGICRRRR